VCLARLYTQAQTESGENRSQRIKPRIASLGERPIQRLAGEPGFLGKCCHSTDRIRNATGTARSSPSASIASRYSAISTWLFRWSAARNGRLADFVVFPVAMSFLDILRLSALVTSTKQLHRTRSRHRHEAQTHLTVPAIHAVGAAILLLFGCRARWPILPVYLPELATRSAGLRAGPSARGPAACGPQRHWGSKP